MKNGEKATVLIIDDEAANLGVLFEHLRQSDLRVIVAEDGASALERVRRNQPDIILLDIKLPDIDGFELCRRLKKAYGSVDTPIIFLSALSDTAHKLKGLDMSAVDYITKPFEPREVVARVEKHLTIHNLRQQLEEQNAQLQQEIAERARAEELLRESEARWRSLVNNAPERIMSLDRDGVILFTNRTGPGRTKEQTIGTSIYNYLSPDEQDKLRQALESIFKGGETEKYAATVVRANGDKMYYENSIAPIKHDDRVVAAIIMAADVSQRARAEAKLQASEEKYRLITETSADGIFSLDLDGTIIFSNQAHSETLGYGPGELIGEHFLSGAVPDGQALGQELFTQLLDGKRVEGETVARHKDGHELPVYYHVAPIIKQGQVIGVTGVLKDITERVRAEEELLAYSERLQDMVQERTQELRDAQEQLLRQEKLTVLGQLAGGVAHELRNPLGAIKNAAYFLNMVLETPDPDINNMLAILDREVDTSERIIRSLLDFARTNVPVRQKVDLNHVIQASLHRSSVPENVQAALQLDEALPSIQADPDQLERIFDNLIRNAIQAMPDGGRLVLQSQLSEPGWATVSCNDTGVGIPPENLGKLFEPLFSTKAKGIGLGLAISKTLVQAQGGNIEVESQVDQGSTFTIRLPTNGGDEKQHT